MEELSEFMKNIIITENSIEMAIIFIVVVFYEAKFHKPITHIFGKPNLFEGTWKQKLRAWICFISALLGLLLKIKV